MDYLQYVLSLVLCSQTLNKVMVKVQVCVKQAAE